MPHIFANRIDLYIGKFLSTSIAASVGFNYAHYRILNIGNEDDFSIIGSIESNRNLSESSIRYNYAFSIQSIVQK